MGFRGEVVQKCGRMDYEWQVITIAHPALRDRNIMHTAYQGPVVQSIVSLTSSLVVKMLTVLVSTIPNSQVFLMKKCE